MWRIIYAKKAQKTLEKLIPKTRERIKSAIDKLRDGPYNRKDLDIKQLKGSDNWRLRVGDWRIIFFPDKGRIIILILEIDTRGDVYKK